MTSRLRALTVEAHDPARLASFWAALLRRDVVQDPLDPLGARVQGSDDQLGLRFVARQADEVDPRRMHLHLTSTDADDQRRTVARALELGADHLDVGQLPEEQHVVLADPEGYAFCVIEPGNSFLAGCGFLGELTCTGPRDVGLFWAEALGWPLVWDQHQETAVQSPLGGTKVSWGGEPPAPRHGRDRLRFDLTVPDEDAAAEVDRLVALGAVRLGGAGDGTLALADPDGTEFSIHVGG